MTVAWVTGARGFIGRHLALELAQNGITVAGIGHGAWVDDDAAQWGVKCWINGEIVQSNFDRLANLVGLPDMIFHLAGGSSVGVSLQTPEEDFRRSVDSTICLLEWVRNHAARSRLVLASSAAVYGAGYSRPIRETDLTEPYSPYGYHKRITELLFQSYSRNYGLYTGVVRMFSVYGPELRKQLLWDLCNRLRTNPKKIELAGSGLETRDWLYVSDAAAYLHKTALLADQNCFLVNGGRGIGTTVKEIAERVREAWEIELGIVFNGISRAGDPHYLVADIELGRSLGLMSIIDWRDGIKKYVTWFRQAEGSKPA